MGHFVKDKGTENGAVLFLNNSHLLFLALPRPAPPPNPPNTQGRNEGWVVPELPEWSPFQVFIRRNDYRRMVFNGSDIVSEWVLMARILFETKEEVPYT
jgi:hypothetical protein